MIYHMVVTVEDHWYIDKTFEGAFGNRHFQVIGRVKDQLRCNMYATFHSGVLLTASQIRSEALSLYYQHQH